MKCATLDTPYRRRKIRQLARNEFRGCSVVFTAGIDGGLAFQIQSQNGRIRSGVIALLPHHGKVRLNAAWLKRHLINAQK